MAENPRIEELRRRVQADPASIVFAALAEEFRRVGRYEEAVETCRKGLQRHPAYLSARVTLGRALIETGDFDGAREQLETVLRSAPENLAAIRGLAQIHERLGHSTELDPHLADMMTTHAESIRVAAISAPATEPLPAPAAPEPNVFSLAPLDDAPFDGAPFDNAQGRRGRPEPEPALSMAPEPAAQGAPVETAASTDPFAAFAPASKPAAAPDFSFDLAPAPAIDLPIAPPVESEPILDLAMEEVDEPAFPSAEPETILDVSMEAVAEPALPSTTHSADEAAAPIVSEVQFEPAPFDEAPLDGAPLDGAPFDGAQGRQGKPEPEPESEPESEPYQEPEPLDDAPFDEAQGRRGRPVLHLQQGPDPAILATLARLERFLDAIHSSRA